jgi:glycosyltransferase involved in cell wall biosynthesis
MISIDVFTVAHNEEKMVKFFIEHYAPIARKIYIIDHESTDKTAEVARSYGELVAVIPVSFPFSNAMLNHAKHHFSSQSDADFVIASDTDELLFPRQMLPYLEDCKSEGCTVPLTVGYQMVSDKFNFDCDNIYDIRRGFRDPMFDKNIIFSPKIDIGWTPGQHKTIPSLCGNGYCESKSQFFQLRHYKFIDFDNMVNRNKIVGERLDKAELAAGIGFHHVMSRDEQLDIYLKTKLASVELL